MTTTSARPSGPLTPGTASGKALGAGANWVDERYRSSNFMRRAMNKVFPDHWSFMIGEIALYSFVILLITGVYLTFFYVPSVGEVVYDGSYEPLRGQEISLAYDTTLRISFDVKGGLLIRQVHHWAALLFVASIVVHLMRIFFTGAFRKPREVNWVIGVTLLVLAIFEGFAGYSLPDDLLSGTGLRIMWSIILSIPVVGTWLAFLIFGGEYPGTIIIERLYVAHILLIPGVLTGLITAHLMILWFQKHTQFRGPGRTETNVVGSRMFPGYAAKGGGFFFIVFAMLALLGGVTQINPIWLIGPYSGADVIAGSQPDWYVGWLDGATRLTPNWEFSALGYTLPFMLFLPGVIMAGLIFTLLALYPFIEQRFITKDNDYHHLLDRPRDNPTRTAIGVMSLTFYSILWMSGGNDLIAAFFDISLNAMTWGGRIALIVLPPLSYVLTHRLVMGLQRLDSERAHHGLESGVIRRLPSGEFVEVHTPLPEYDRPLMRAIEAEHAGEGVPALPDGEVQEAESRGRVGGGRRVRGFFVKESTHSSAPRDGAPDDHNESTGERRELSGQQ